MHPFATLISPVVVLPVNNIDTDQIIPARFLKVTDKLGLGAALFSDWRYNSDGSPKPEFALNQPAASTAHILLAGHNFGCGSSREHAPWALVGFGFRAVIATSFADIFRNNALKNGLLPVALKPEDHLALKQKLAAEPGIALTIDLASQQVRLPDGQTFSFPIDEFSKICLLNGVDELGYLLGLDAQISAYEQSHA
jgi:3-isopropylmalate/(R)-2-methylmalate dehydratase small subunit